MTTDQVASPDRLVIDPSRLKMVLVLSLTLATALGGLDCASTHQVVEVRVVQPLDIAKVSVRCLEVPLSLHYECAVRDTVTDKVIVVGQFLMLPPAGDFRFDPSDTGQYSGWDGERIHLRDGRVLGRLVPAPPGAVERETGS